MELIKFIVISCFYLSYSCFAHAETAALKKNVLQNFRLEIDDADNTTQAVNGVQLLKDPEVKKSVQSMSEYLQDSKRYQEISRGGESSGGANGLRCHNEQNIILQDYLNDDPDFLEKFTPGDVIEISPFAHTLGYDRISKLNRFTSYALAKHRLSIWSQNSPVIISLIMEAMDRMAWLYTPYRQLAARGSEVSDKVLRSCYNTNLFSIVVYDARIGARISAPIWNSLGLFSQAGVLVHEALRHISHFYKNYSGQENSLTTEQIIYITKTIMTKTPSNSESLDRVTSYQGILMDLLARHYQENPMEMFCRIGSKVLADVDPSALAQYKNSPHLNDFTRRYSAFRTILVDECNKQKTKIFDVDRFNQTRSELYRMKEAADDLFLSDISIDEMVRREQSLKANKEKIWRLIQQLFESNAALKNKSARFCKLLEACRPYDVFLFELDQLRRELSGAYSDFLIARIGSRVLELQDLEKATRFALLENAETVLKKYLANADIELPSEVKKLFDEYIFELQHYHNKLISSGVFISSY